MPVPNFPTKPNRGYNTNSFPSDLVSGERQFYTSISFIDYKLANATGGLATMGFGGGIMLPMPRKINDVETALWEEWSGLEQAQAIAGRLPMIGGVLKSAADALVSGAQYYSTFTGQTVNPYQFMMYKRPAFKEHTFQWILAPSNQQESQTIKRIVDQCKNAALPIPGTVMMDYPQVAQVTFRTPGNYLFKLKPCAIISVQVDYTAAGAPSFFKSGAPTVVGLSLQLKEIELWKRGEVN